MAQIIRECLFGLNKGMYEFKIYLSGSSVYIEQRDFDINAPVGVFLEISLSDWKEIVEFINHEKSRNV